MVEKTVENPFDELPEALVEEMLNQCDELGENLSNSFRKLFERKNEIRKNLTDHNLLKKMQRYHPHQLIRLHVVLTAPTLSKN